MKKIFVSLVFILFGLLGYSQSPKVQNIEINNKANFKPVVPVDNKQLKQAPGDFYFNALINQFEYIESVGVTRTIPDTNDVVDIATRVAEGIAEVVQSVDTTDQEVYSSHDTDSLLLLKQDISTAIQSADTTGSTPEIRSAYDVDSIMHRQLVVPKYDADHYVATWGSDAAAGDFYHPWATWEYGFNQLVAGDTLYIRGGTYTIPTPSDTYVCEIHNVDGTSTNYISVFNYPGEIPIFDLSGGTSASGHKGIYIDTCDYWHLKGLHVKGTQSGNGSIQPAAIAIHGTATNNCTGIILENCVTYDNEGVGISLGHTNNSLVLNCDSYNNNDPVGSTNGNGMEIVYCDSATVNTFRGCRAWNNTFGEGFGTWDVQGIITYDSCWSWSNTGSSGDGSGFELGLTYAGPMLVTQRYVKNCIAVNNNYGYNQASAGVLMELYNNTAYSNTIGYEFEDGGADTITFKNNIAYDNGTDFDDDGIQIHSNNSWDLGIAVSDADFVSIDTLLLLTDRKVDGSLPDISFFKLRATSDLIDAGVNIGIDYKGMYPDLGCFESEVTNKYSVYRNIRGIYPGEIVDDSTLAWFVYDDMSTITKGATDSVSLWKDKLGSGHDLIMDTVGHYPLWTSSGIQFDGVDQYLQTTAFTYSQPIFIYIVFKPVTWTSGDWIITGLTGGAGLFQTDVTPGMAAYAGTTSTYSYDFTLGNWSIARMQFNGASSKLIANNKTSITGNFGANNPGGITLGRSISTDTKCSNIIVKEIIIRSGVETSADEYIIYNYLRAKYNL